MEDKLQLIYLQSTMLQDLVQDSIQANRNEEVTVSPLSNTQALATDLG